VLSLGKASRNIEYTVNAAACRVGVVVGLWEASRKHLSVYSLLATFWSVGYNAASSPLPEDLPELSVALDENLSGALRHLKQFRTEKTLSNDDTERAVGLYAAVIGQNDHFSSLLKGWQRLKLVPKGKACEVRRLLGVLERTTTTARRIIEAARSYKVTPQPVVLDFHISDLAVVEAVIEIRITGTTAELERLREATRVSLPMLKQRGLANMIADYHDAQRMLAGLPALVRRWRRAGVTPEQEERLKVLAAREKLLRAKTKTLLAVAESLKGKTFKSFDDDTRVINTIGDLVVDA
jgi:hypothetical protein